MKGHSLSLRNFGSCLHGTITTIAIVVVRLFAISSIYNRNRMVWLPPYDTYYCRNRILWLFSPRPVVVIISDFYCTSLRATAKFTLSSTVCSRACRPHSISLLTEKCDLGPLLKSLLSLKGFASATTRSFLQRTSCILLKVHSRESRSTHWQILSVDFKRKKRTAWPSTQRKSLTSAKF